MKRLNNLTDQARDALEHRGIAPEVAEQHGVVSAQAHGDDQRQWIAFRHDVDGENDHYAYRTLTGDKQFLQSKGTERRLWNNRVVSDQELAQEALIFTEGQMDALALLSVGFGRVVSVPDGAPSGPVEGDGPQGKYAYLDRAKLEGVKEIILATDGDQPGLALRYDLAIRLGRHRCRFIVWPPKCKDACDVLAEYGAEELVRCIRCAKWMQLDGCYRWNDLPEMPAETPNGVGIEGLDDLWKPSPGRLTVLTGIPGHGKSSLITDVSCHMAERGDVVCLASFEHDVRMTLGPGLMRRLLGKDPIYATREERQTAEQLIQRQFVFIQQPPESDDANTIDWLLERIAAMATRNNAKFVVIDPWNEIDHTNRPVDVSPTEYVGVMLTRMRRHARQFDYHLLVAAHPTKLGRDKDGQFPIATGYNIADSANWVNKPDTGLTVYRHHDKSVTISCWKCRAEGIIGRQGSEMFRFNDMTNTYSFAPDLEQSVAA